MQQRQEMSEISSSLEKVASALKRAERVAVLTGAGMSVASGLPTYRGIGGLYDGIEVEAGMPIEEILHAYTMARNPALTWKYIAQIGQACSAAEPNEGHRILCAWERHFETYVITQNVDGFHRRAGSAHVTELHGNFDDLFCSDCERRFMMADFDFSNLPPRCTDCDGLVRPNVVLFGEMLPPQALASYERELAVGFNVILAIGTTAGFPYIYEPVLSARQRGTFTAEINPDDTELSAAVDVHLKMPAVDALSMLEQQLSQKAEPAAG